MGIETAIIGGAILGAGGSIIGSSKASSAAKDAARTQAASADRAAELQNQMFQQQQQYLAPYRQSGYSAQPLLEYLTTGVMPTLTPQEQQELATLQGIGSQQFQQPAESQQTIPMESTGAQTFQQRMSGWNPEQNGAMAVQPQQQSAPVQEQPTELTTEQQTRLEQLLGRQNAMQSAQGGLQGIIENSPMYQYQRDIGEKNLNRYLAARGRSNSTFGINAMGDQNRALLANESQNLYNRVANLSNQGMGVAAQLGQNAMSAGTNIGNLYQNAGNAIAQGQQAAGQQQASLYSNLGALPMQAYNNYQLTSALGSGGGGGGFSSGGGFSPGAYNAMQHLGGSSGLLI